MTENQEPTPAARRGRRLLGAGGLLGAGLLAGGILAGVGVATAATSSPSQGSATATHRAGDPAAMSHGPGETLVKGADLSTLTDAAKATEPGATIIRVETDADGGAAYEAHMQKSDGSYVTVQFDSSLKVAGTTTGFGPGGPPRGPNA